MADDKAEDVKPAVDDTTPAAPSAEEKKEVDPVEEGLKDEPEEKSKETPEKPKKAEEQKEEPAKAEEPEEPEKQPEIKGKADERKTQLNTEIRDLVSKRNALKTEVEKANAEVYQPATEDELAEQGLSATDAKVEALRQQVEMRDYNERVAEAQLTLSSESERVLSDFPIFDSESESYDKELATEAAELLEANLVYDENTKQVIGSNVSPYQLYKTLARASNVSTVKGQMKGQAATEQMLANADTAASSGPPKSAKDPVLEILASDDY